MRKYFILLLVCSLPLFAENTPVLSKRDQPYRIQPSDRLELQYRYTPEYNQSIEVQPDGMASVTLIGTVKLAVCRLRKPSPPFWPN
jgi:polysaccharide export outer membrane protein